MRNEEHIRKNKNLVHGDKKQLKLRPRLVNQNEILSDKVQELFWFKHWD